MWTTYFDNSEQKHRRQPNSLGLNSPSEPMRLLDHHGFTLLELLLATAIATLVVAILSVALTFSLRMWEHQRGNTESGVPRIIELMKLQLACFDPVKVTFEGQSKPIFRGGSSSLALATDYSVKALSGGVAVVARYIYDSKEKTLYYAEIPLDPYHPEAIENFLQMSPGKENSWPRFYPIKVPDFSLSYQQEEGAKFVATWNSDKELPQTIQLKWGSDDDRVITDELVPNFLFPISTDSSGTNTQSGSLN